MDPNHGLIHAYLLNGKGGARRLGSWQEVAQCTPDDGVLWIHLDISTPDAREWIDQSSSLDEIVCEVLTARETRPRVVQSGEGLIVILRGVNLNAGADPEDMVAIRGWFEAHRVITLRAERLQAADDLRKALDAGEGPNDAAQILVDLCDRLIERMGPVLDQLSDDIDGVEEEMVESTSQSLRTRLGVLRRTSIALRRYLAPQRDVLARLVSERAPWLSERDRLHLREVSDRLTRYVEELDASRDRAAVTQEELAARLAEQMNRTMYVLSLVAGIFLPLGLLTGLLGINVGGMPGVESNIAFTIVCLVLIGLAVVGVWIFRRLRFF